MKKQKTNNKKLNVKQNKGITLLALIITIIILLIIAVVTIRTIDNNKIINYAENSASAWKKAEQDEISQLASLEDYLNKNYGNNDLNNLKKIILGDNLQGKDVLGILDGENEEITILSKVWDMTADDEYHYIAYIKYKNNIYKFRYINRDDYTSDSSYEINIIEDIDENTREGKKVKIKDTMWTVLYDDETRGLQIVSDTSLGEKTLGDEYSDTNAVDDYNNAITKLNTACEELLKNNSDYNTYIEYMKDIRCVGSNPINKDQEGANTFEVSKEIKLNLGEENYLQDYDRMTILNIAVDSDNEYWLASRFVGSDGETKRFSVWSVYEGNATWNDLLSYEADVDKPLWTSKDNVYEYGLRPVIKINTEKCKLEYHEGEDGNYYTLENIN